MEHYLHRVLGIYETRVEAQAARDRLVERGLAPDKVKVFASLRQSDRDALSADSDDVLKEVLRETAIGTAVGTAAGAVGAIALAAANLSLFVASPLLAPLTMLGWGASAGAIVGGAAGAQRNKGDVSDVVKDALSKGHVILLAHTISEDQATAAREVIGESMAELNAAPDAAGA